jgi:phosphate:Na+ symporter
MKDIIFGVAGGLALFIYGMNLMGEGLKKAAGERMRIILETITKNPISGIIVGVLVTMIIQSSSATTVMVVGFVNARLMTLRQAIGVIMGATIGTTITAQLIAFNIGDYAYPIAALGFILFFFVKFKNWQYIGEVLFGLGILFIGLNTMSATLKPLAGLPIFAEWIVNLGKHPILGVLVGTIMTVVVQSSSATVGVLQTIASQPIVINNTIQPLIPLTSAIPILLGDNIGTTITALLASIGTNKAAKRAAVAHTLIKIFGTLIFILLMPLFIELILRISPQVNLNQDITVVDIIKRQIANAHTAFNTLNTVIWIPFIGFLAMLVTKIIPGEDVYIEKGVKYLNRRVVNNAAVALELSAKELVRMGEFASEMLTTVKNAFLSVDTSTRAQVDEFEETLDYLQEQIINYMSTVVSQISLTEPESLRLTDLMHVVGDIERIGDHCVNVIELSEYKTKEGLKFSTEANQELERIFDLTSKMVSGAVNALRDNDFDSARHVLELETKMDRLEEELRFNHINRLNHGACNPSSAVCYVEITKNLERIADHCNNIAEAVLDQNKE